MRSWVVKYFAVSSTFVAILLLVFNVYYFFIRQGVGFLFYMEKLFGTAKDIVLQTPEYHDLVAQYYHFNMAYGDREVIVFLGDSLTKGFNLQEHFHDHMILNRGINSDTTVSLLNRLDKNIEGLRIKKIFILIGYNDLQYRDDIEIVGNIGLILDRLKAGEVYLQTLLPVDFKMKPMNDRITKINSMLRKLCSEKRIGFIDLHSHFIDKSGGLSRYFTIDGIHLNGRGYQLWEKLIKENL